MRAAEPSMDDAHLGEGGSVPGVHNESTIHGILPLVEAETPSADAHDGEGSAPPSEVMTEAKYAYDSLGRRYALNQWGFRVR